MSKEFTYRIAYATLLYLHETYNAHKRKHSRQFSIREIAHEMNVDTGDISGVMSALASCGYVTREKGDDGQWHYLPVVKHKGAMPGRLSRTEWVMPEEHNPLRNVLKSTDETNSPEPEKATTKAKAKKANPKKKNKKAKASSKKSPEVPPECNQDLCSVEDNSTLCDVEHIRGPMQELLDHPDYQTLRSYQQLYFKLSLLHELSNLNRVVGPECKTSYYLAGWSTQKVSTINRTLRQLYSAGYLTRTAFTTENQQDSFWYKPVRSYNMPDHQSSRQWTPMPQGLVDFLNAHAAQEKGVDTTPPADVVPPAQTVASEAEKTAEVLPFPAELQLPNSINAFAPWKSGWLQARASFFLHKAIGRSGMDEMTEVDSHKVIFGNDFDNLMRQYALTENMNFTEMQEYFTLLSFAIGDYIAERMLVLCLSQTDEIMDDILRTLSKLNDFAQEAQSHFTPRTESIKAIQKMANELFD